MSEIAVGSRWHNTRGECWRACGFFGTPSCIVIERRVDFEATDECPAYRLDHREIVPETIFSELYLPCAEEAHREVSESAVRKGPS